jgi:hypothetical protein
LSNNPIDTKIRLLDGWLAKAAKAEAERNGTESRYRPEAYHNAADRTRIYSEAARILASTDGIDHVKEALRTQLGQAKGESAIRVWASLITELETATA